MRYNPGTKELFIHIAFTPMYPSFFSLYKPWQDKLERIEIIQLTCVEHHKVKWGYAEDIPENYTSDGYVFKDGDGYRWLNQYPTADFGQIDDSANWKVHMEDFGDQIDWEGDHRHYEDVRIFLNRILRGLRPADAAVPGVVEEPIRASLQKFYDDLVLKIKEEFGIVVNTKARVLNFTDGRPPKVLEDSLEVFFEPVEPEVDMVFHPAAHFESAEPEV